MSLLLLSSCSWIREPEKEIVYVNRDVFTDRSIGLDRLDGVVLDDDPDVVEKLEIQGIELEDIMLNFEGESAICFSKNMLNY